MPTQYYDVPSRKVRRRFFGILYVQLDEVRARKWNSESMITFQSVILKHDQDVNNPRNICTFILLRLDSWNYGAFDKLVKDTFNTATGCLEKSRGMIQTKEQRHRTFLIIVLKRKLREAVQFFCEREKGGVLQP